MRRHMLPVMLLPCLAMLAVGCASLPKASADFGEIEKEIKTVTVMPPAFTLEKVGAVASETISEMTYDIECEIKAAAETLVAKSRFELAPLDASDEALAADPDLRKMLFDQASEIARAADSIASIKGKTINIDFKSDIDYFADRANSDYFLFMRGAGWFKTGGAKALDFVAIGLFGGVSYGSSTTIEAFLVDATRGKVIWYNRATGLNQDPRKPSQIMNVCSQLMKPITGKVEIEKDSSRDHEITDKYKNKDEGQQ